MICFTKRFILADYIRTVTINSLFFRDIRCYIKLLYNLNSMKLGQSYIILNRLSCFHIIITVFHFATELRLRLFAFASRCERKSKLQSNLNDFNLPNIFDLVVVGSRENHFRGWKHVSVIVTNWVYCATTFRLFLDRDSSVACIIQYGYNCDIYRKMRLLF